MRGIAGLILLLVLSPAWAGDGRIPLWEPTVITQSGSYVVTRDILGPGIVLDITATATDVHVDLNGFTLETTSTGPTVRVAGTPGSTQGGVTIENGTLLAAESPLAMRPLTFEAKDAFSFKGIFMQANGRANIEMVKEVHLRHLRASALKILGSLTRPATGSVVDAKFDGADDVGFELVNGAGFLARDIGVEQPGSHGMRVAGCNACLFERIRVKDALETGMQVENAKGNRFENITVIGSLNAFFVDLLSQGNAFTDVTGSNSLTGGVGFDNQGSQTHLTRGTFHGNPGGGMKNSGSEFSFRQTISRGNGSPNFDDTGFNTWDAGDNCIDI